MPETSQPPSHTVMNVVKHVEMAIENAQSRVDAIEQGINVFQIHPKDQVVPPRNNMEILTNAKILLEIIILSSILKATLKMD